MLRKLFLLISFIFIFQTPNWAQDTTEISNTADYIRRRNSSLTICTLGRVYLDTSVSPARFKICSVTNTPTTLLTSSSISGTNNKVVKFNSSSTIGDSSITDTGTSIDFQSKWTINSSSHFVPNTNNVKDIGNGTLNPRDINVGRKLTFYGTSTGDSNSGFMSISADTSVGASFTLILPASNSIGALVNDGLGNLSFIDGFVSCNGCVLGDVPYFSGAGAIEPSGITKLGDDYVIGGVSKIIHLADDRLVVDDNISQIIIKDHTHLNSTSPDNDRSGAISFAVETSKTKTFTVSYTEAPVCVVSPTEDTSGNAWWIEVTNIALTIHTASGYSGYFNYICVGNPN